MTLGETLWRTVDEARCFILADAEPRRPGSLALRSLAGDAADVDPDWAARYEVSEAEARAWAQDEFGFVLDELRYRIDAKLARARASLDAAKHAPVSPDSSVTPDAVPAVWALIKSLPGVIGGSLSGDAARVERASGTMAALQRRLIAAGIDVDARFADFPDRLAGLRTDFAKHEAAPPPDADPQPDK